MVYRRPGQPADSGGLIAVVCFAIILFGLGMAVYHVHRDRNESADLERMQVLRVELGPIRNRLLTIPRDSSERPKLESRAVEIVGEHNAILSRHPTWNVPPLTLDFIR